ncbi:DUF397 domain-containing protein [Dactylosporangium sp. NPDC005555]|uniref:DUF397 domain-containing protein n=1 Tax=Dactylosporangium sp. NPDC005555 TaxID=3154889 RepID=UPI0033B73C14
MQEVQAPLMWRRSTACLNGACVEVADGPDAIFVRDSKVAAGPFLEFHRADWATFIGEVVDGRMQQL